MPKGHSLMYNGILVALTFPPWLRRSVKMSQDLSNEEMGSTQQLRGHTDRRGRGATPAGSLEPRMKDCEGIKRSTKRSNN